MFQKTAVEQKEDFSNFPLKDFRKTSNLKNENENCISGL